MQQIVTPHAGSNLGLLSTSVMGVDLNVIAFHDAIDKLIDIAIETKRKSSVKIGFVNANSINVLWSDVELQQAISAFDYIFPDGIGLKIASYFQGVYPVHNISGTDLVPELLAAFELTGQRVFLLGDQPEAIGNVAWHFQRLFPTSVLAGYHHGFFDADSCDNVIELINYSESDILLVGMSTPKQEKWLIRHGSALDVGIQIAVGGLFQYWDNRLRRAPLYARKLGLEWLCILFQQPHKWRRYILGNPLFLIRALRSSLNEGSSSQ